MTGTVLKGSGLLLSILFLANRFPGEVASTSEDTKTKTFYSSFDFTSPGGFTAGIEGPAVDKQGNVYAVNFKEEGTIGQVSPDGAAAVFAKLPEGSVGNGIRFNSKGTMLVADYTGHNILKIDMSTRQISVFAHESSMNQPNDIAIGKNDIVYASDPNWKESTGQIWKVDLQGKMTLLEKNMGTTNGIEVSADEKRLYVNESVQRKVWVYDLSPQGVIGHKRLLIEFPDYGMDGMRCDVKGNLYITRYGKGTVVKVSPQGKILQEIQLTGKKPSNLTFGGKDGRTCFVTLADRGCIEAFLVEEPGRCWKLLHE